MGGLCPHRRSDRSRMKIVPEKSIFQPLHNDKKSVLSIKESFSMGKTAQNFHKCLLSGWGGDPSAPPPVTVRLTVECTFFVTTSLCNAYKVWKRIMIFFLNPGKYLSYVIAVINCFSLMGQSSPHIQVYSTVNFAPLRPAGFCQFFEAGRGDLFLCGAGWGGAGRAVHPCQKMALLGLKTLCFDLKCII